MTRIHPQSSTVFRPMTRNLLLLCTVLLAACGEAPKVSVFTAAPGTIAKGTSAKLVFAAEGADKLTLDPGVGDVTGKTEVEVKPEQTTTYTLTATNGSGNATQTLTVNVGPTPAAGFKIEAAGAFTAGTPTNVTVTAVDPSGAPVPSYTGTVHLVSNDGAAELPADFAFAAEDNGVKTVPVTFRTAGARVLVASGTVGGGMQGSFSTTSAAFTVKAGPGARMNLSGLPAEAESGAEVSFQVSFVDAFGNVAADYATQLNVQHSDDTAPAAQSAVEASNGSATIRLSFFKAGVHTITVQDTHNDNAKATAEIRVRPSQAVSYALSALPATARVGEPLSLTITALDAKGNRAHSYSGKASISSADAAMELPADASFSQGVAVVSVAFRTPGDQTVTATQVGGGLTATTPSVKVTSAEAARIILSATNQVTVGGATSLTATVVDTFGNTVTGYRGTVGFSSTDANAVLPGAYTFTEADSGTRTFSATLDTVGAQSITVQDSQNGNLKASAEFQVRPGTAVSYALSALPATARVGEPLSLTITALDAKGNRAHSYSGKASISSADAAMELPAEASFSQGVAVVSVAFRTPGDQTVTATEVGGSLTATTPSVKVTSAEAARIVLSNTGPVTAGGATSFVATVVDAFGNTVTGYRGTVGFGSTDSNAVIPGAYTFTEADSGTRTFSATLQTAGTQSISVEDRARTAITGSGTFSVSPAAASGCDMSDVPATAIAGAQLPVRVTVRDAFANTVSGYSGTVAITSTDAHTSAATPAPATYVPAKDQGSRLFSAKLVSAGGQTITATDATGGWSCTASVTINPAAPQIHVMLPTDANASHPVEATVSVKDAYGNAISYAGTLSFSSTDTAATLPANLTLAGTESGTSKVTATFNTVGAQELKATLVGDASLSGSAITAVHGFVYTDPTPGTGKVRFVLNQAASSASVVQLDLVSNTTVIATASGSNVRGGVYSAGMNLPLDNTRVMAGSPLLVEGNTFNLGAAPKAVAAALPASGSTSGVLYTGVSQKFDGAGKAIGDVSITVGYVFYSVRLKLPATATVGSVFNGPSLDQRFRAAVRNRAGDEVFSNADFALGKLEVR